MLIISIFPVMFHQNRGLFPKIFIEKWDFFRNFQSKKGNYSMVLGGKKGTFSVFYFPYNRLTLSSKYLSGDGAGASPILLPLRMRMYSGKVRML